MSLVPAALLCIAAASIGGRVAAEPPQVLVHNADNQDVLVTIADLNTPNATVIVNEQPLDANVNLPVNARLDSHGAYFLHWKVQDPGRTKTEEGNCQDTPVFTCHITLFAAR